jgi:hypothetical protein
MVKINNRPKEILVDLFYNGVFVATLNYWQQLDVREQISILGCNGYSLFINKKFRHLYEANLQIEFFEVVIDNGGGVNRWFPNYFHSEKYGYVGTYSDLNVITRRIYNNQLNDLKNSPIE